MIAPLIEALRPRVSGERALETVRALAGFHRVQASPGYDAAAAWLAERLRAAGLEPEVERVPADGRTRALGWVMPEGWECRRARAVLVDGGERRTLCDYDDVKLSLILRSDSVRGRFPIVALDDDEAEGVDVRGAVVLTGAAVHRVLDRLVHARGAAGILYDGRRLLPPVRDALTDPDQVAYTSFWWAGDAPRGWGFVVSPRTGAELRARLRAGARLELEAEIDSRRFATEIPLLAARVPGDRPGEILVVAHLCHPQPSANDNASGVAAALEVARALAERPAESPRHGVRFLFVPEFTGTHAWLARDPARAAATLAAVNLDMVGQSQERCGSTLLIEHPPWFAASFAEALLARARAAAVDWVPSYSGPGHFSMTRMAEVPFSGGSDHEVLIDPAIGVPCPMLIQWPDRYYHSSHDTPDKSDPDSLALAARTAAAYAAFLAERTTEDGAWLLAGVERDARTRLLRALEASDPEREALAARLAGDTAIASLSRLGLGAGALERARAGFEAFAAREATGTRAVPPTWDAAAAAAIPRRAFAAPLDRHRHQLPGWERLDAAARERWRSLERDTPESGTLFALAWASCDGRRTLGEIAQRVWIETGAWAPEAIERFLAALADLELVHHSRGEGSWSSSAPATATP